ncbi:MAG: hypothetical protein M4579_000361 [Chaenotheca gracillima]|nr:MAG: hypothetical protein M4579_000361 [Chaenotheca gracillima]
MSASPLELVQSNWTALKPQSPIYGLLLENISIISASEGEVKARLRVEKIHVNSKKTLHGTVSACLIDWIGSLAIASRGREKTGLSTDIHISYVGGAAEGEMLEIEGRTSKVGANLAFTTATISKADSGQVVATGSHTKYVRQ